MHGDIHECTGSGDSRGAVYGRHYHVLTLFMEISIFHTVPQSHTVYVENPAGPEVAQTSASMVLEYTIVLQDD